MDILDRKSAEDGRTAARHHRLNDILEALSVDEEISIKNICSRYHISPVTARADLELLEQQGKLQRVRGGARSLAKVGSGISELQRVDINTNEKTIIGRTAAEFVHDGDSIIADAGSTVYFFVKALEDKTNITFITMDLAVAYHIVMRVPSIDLIFVGGNIQKRPPYSYGRLARETIEKIHADVAIVSADGFTPEQGFMTITGEVSEMKRAAITHATKRIMLLDSSKIGRNSFISFAGLDDFDYVITNADPDGVLAKTIAHSETRPQLIIAK